MRVLALDTTTAAGSVAIVDDDEVLLEEVGDSTRSHAERLPGDILRAVERCGITIPSIDVFAIAAGPGTFTGLRIGIATIKALAETLNRPSAGIPTLEAIALSGGTSEASVALLPAGRGEVFTQMFCVTGDSSVKALDEPAHIPPARLLERYGHLQTLTWCGEGANTNRELIESSVAGRNWRIASDTTNLAAHVARLAFDRFTRRQFDDGYSLRAIYVRPADAQLKT